MTVAQLKSQRKTKKSSFNTYVKRRDAIKTIIDRIDSKLDDDVNDVNDQINKCIAELQDGLKGSSKVSKICSDMYAAKENKVGSDSTISSCRGYLSSEKTRCQGRINTLDSEIRYLESRIKAQGGTIYFWE
ncbi:MAG: hypothetical protein IJD93_00790 [Ruminococcus sp.]|nr:hypothetical protein [Ruminococcus sp.]